MLNITCFDIFQILLFFSLFEAVILKNDDDDDYDDPWAHLNIAISYFSTTACSKPSCCYSPSSSVHLVRSHDFLPGSFQHYPTLSLDNNCLFRVTDIEATASGKCPFKSLKFLYWLLTCEIHLYSTEHGILIYITKTVQVCRAIPQAVAAKELKMRDE